MGQSEEKVTSSAEVVNAINVYLSVNAGVDLSTITQQNVKDKVTVSSDGTPPELPGDPRDWEIKVKKNQKINWRGMDDLSRQITIKIKEISRDANSSVQILKKDQYFDNNNDGVVKGQAKNEQVSGIEYYTIYFIINSLPKMYIDPRLQMN